MPKLIDLINAPNHYEIKGCKIWKTDTLSNIVINIEGAIGWVKFEYNVYDSSVMMIDSRGIRTSVKSYYDVDLASIGDICNGKSSQDNENN